MGAFVMIAININEIVGVLEKDNVMLAYVDENLSDSEARALASTLRNTQNVSKVSFVTREQAMDDFLSKYINTERYKDVQPEWFRHRYIIYVDDVELIPETQFILKDTYGIAQVNANLKIAQGLVTARNIVSGVSIVIIVVLLTISLFIMSNTIKLATFERREEIAIMKMVGATNSFIRWPFIYEGFILGITGSLAAFAALFALYGLVASKIVITESAFLSVVPFSNVSLPIFVVFVAIGFGVGVGGSSMALNKYLNV